MGLNIWEGNKAQQLINETKQIADGIARQNLLLSQMITGGEATPAAELAEIHRIVQSGEAPRVFSIGDQLMLNYNNGTRDYVLPWDVVHFGDVELQDGEIVPGMYIQSHYALDGIQFDTSEAIYVASADMPGGTYYFTIGTNWGTHCVSGSSYNFTTTKTIPQGGQIMVGRSNNAYLWGAPDLSPSDWKVHTFSSWTDTTPLETNLELASGASGTSLGSIASDTLYSNSGVNNLQRAAYGYNRWSQSAMRQWLNSRAAAGQWWTPQNPFDRAPEQLSSKRGFMAGLDEAFLNIVRPVKVTTALNTVSDTSIGTSENTFDTFFLPSLEQEYIVPQLADTEGEYWEYWKQRLGASEPEQYHPYINTMHIRYTYDAQTSAQHCRLRSCHRGYAFSTWIVFATGTVTSSGATGAYRGCPAAVIC